MTQKILFKLLILFSFFGYSQNIPLSENAEVSILTCGTGNESYSLYGHTGIRIKDIQNNVDLVYNYGAFDFNTENFILKFIKGDLQYFITVNNYRDFEYSYIAENRSIYEQKLNISTQKKQALFDALNTSLYSESRFYTYKFIDRNCTNMAIDQVNAILEENIIKTKLPVKQTYRDVLFPYTNQHYLEQLGINIIFGTKVDNTAEKLFLPLDLLEVLKESTYQNKKLVSETKTIYEAKKTPFSPSLLNSCWIVIFILAIVVLLNSKKTTSIYFTILGLLGIFFSVVGFYSFHEEVLWNYNVFLFNPLLLLLVFYMGKNNSHKIVLIGKITLAFLIIYFIYVLNKVSLILVLPFIIANSILLTRLILEHKKTLLSFSK